MVARTSIRVVFLDFDGVLNHDALFLALPRDRTTADCLTDARSFDPACVERVNVICERASAVVVVSSSWRCMFKMAVIRSILKRHGLRAKVIGDTPRLHRTPDGEERVRGHEIQAWLDARAKWQAIESFTILDDSADMAHLLPQLVRTPFATGLGDEHVEQAVAMLEGKAAK